MLELTRNQGENWELSGDNVDKIWEYWGESWGIEETCNFGKNVENVIFCVCVCTWVCGNNNIIKLAITNNATNRT